ncbi:TPA_asm: adenain [Terrapene box turtle adintovirus]|uniref:Adenain n=1 Tax=Terrapene box turtle adintovirus TaxID=2597808 RepID=A0A5H3CM23_9VIRU|nr:adenain [Terrapene box turtle adintovirus]DAC80298.1 TPA_asm: adenain [Terrapene box turtle adintovirus]
MDTVQLSRVLSTDPYTKKNFLDVFPCDWLPGRKLSQRPLGLVVNTHPHNQPGEHWLALYLAERNRGEFFDSYGHPPNSVLFPKSIMKFLNKNATDMVFHNRQLQDPRSVACGYHCVFFLHHRSKGLSFDRILKLYSNDLVQNDRMVMNFVKSKFKFLGMPSLAQNMFQQAQTCVSCNDFHSHVTQ